MSLVPAATGNTKPPIIFAWPGLAVDTYLQVFEQPYHVHSAVLKLHSAFFRKYMDSPEKTPNIINSVTYYHWGTEIDDIGWSLQARKNGEVQQIRKAMHKTESAEADAFGLLLRVIYNQPYILHRSDQLKFLTMQAEYYCCLPALAATLDAALSNSKNFIKEITLKAPEIIIYAQKIRHAALFRECFIFVVNKHEYLTTSLIGNVNYNLITRKYTELLLKTTRFALQLIELVGAKSDYCLEIRRILRTCVGDLGGCQALGSSRFVSRLARLLKHHYIYDKNQVEIEEVLNPLLGNASHYLRQIHKDQEDLSFGFLCISVSDAELPWKFGETDW